MKQDYLFSKYAADWLSYNFTRAPLKCSIYAPGFVRAVSQSRINETKGSSSISNLSQSSAFPTPTFHSFHSASRATFAHRIKNFRFIDSPARHRTTPENEVHRRFPPRLRYSHHGVSLQKPRRSHGDQNTTGHQLRSGECSS